MKIQLIYNPLAGSYSAELVRDLAGRLESDGHDIRVEKLDFSLSAGIRLDPACDVLCVIGGDGAVRQVIHALKGSKARLCVVPAGTVNLIALEHGLSDEVERIARTIAKGKTMAFFPARYNGGYFCVTGSVGLDALVAGRVSPGLKKVIGRLAYLVSALHQLMIWKPRTIEVELDGRPIACQGLFIAKGRYYAGPYEIAPAARMGRESLKVCLMKTARRRDYLRLVWLLWRRRPLSGTPFIHKEVGSVKIMTPGLEFQADGDVVCQTPLEISTDRQPLQLLVP